MDLKQPSYVPDPKRLPAPTERQPLVIRPGSRLATVGVFVEVLRRRFSDSSLPEEWPWPWNRDVKASKIAIESAFNEDKSHRDFRPAIYVDCDDQVYGRTVLGDRAGRHIPTSKEFFWALATIGILVECVAAKKAESAEIGDQVGFAIQAASDLVQAKFGFHELTPVTVGRTQPAPADRDQWTTPVTFNVQHTVRWSNMPIAALLAEMEASIRTSGAVTATEFFARVATGV